jgi:hypothetical protein
MISAEQIARFPHQLLVCSRLICSLSEAWGVWTCHHGSYNSLGAHAMRNELGESGEDDLSCGFEDVLLLLISNGQARLTELQRNQRGRLERSRVMLRQYEDRET